jgi:hypothetical protein
MTEMVPAPLQRPSHPVPRTAVPFGQEISAENAAKRLKVGELAAPPTF